MAVFFSSKIHLEMQAFQVGNYIVYFSQDEKKWRKKRGGGVKRGKRGHDHETDSISSR